MELGMGPVREACLQKELECSLETFNRNFDTIIEEGLEEEASAESAEAESLADGPFHLTHMQLLSYREMGILPFSFMQITLLELNTLLAKVTGTDLISGDVRVVGSWTPFVESLPFVIGRTPDRQPILRTTGLIHLSDPMWGETKYRGNENLLNPLFVPTLWEPGGFQNRFYPYATLQNLRARNMIPNGGIMYTADDVQSLSALEGPVDLLVSHRIEPYAFIEKDEISNIGRIVSNVATVNIIRRFGELYLGQIKDNGVAVLTVGQGSYKADYYNRILIMSIIQELVGEGLYKFSDLLSTRKRDGRLNNLFWMKGRNDLTRFNTGFEARLNSMRAFMGCVFQVTPEIRERFADNRLINRFHRRASAFADKQVSNIAFLDDQPSSSR